MSGSVPIRQHAVKPDEALRELVVQVFRLNGMLSAFLPLYGREVLNLSGPELGWLFGVQTVTTLMVRPAIGRLSDRVGRRGVIVTGLTICSLAVFALSAAGTLTAVVVVVLTYAAGVALTTAATSAYITDVTRRARYGAAHGVFLPQPPGCGRPAGAVRSANTTQRAPLNPVLARAGVGRTLAGRRAVRWITTATCCACWSGGRICAAGASR